MSAKESPPWLPVVMLALFVIGGLAIMARYLVFSDSNIPLLVGLVCLLGGLFLATRWRSMSPTRTWTAGARGGNGG